MLLSLEVPLEVLLCLLRLPRLVLLLLLLPLLVLIVLLPPVLVGVTLWRCHAETFPYPTDPPSCPSPPDPPSAAAAAAAVDTIKFVVVFAAVTAAARSTREKRSGPLCVTLLPRRGPELVRGHWETKTLRGHAHRITQLPLVLDAHVVHQRAEADGVHALTLNRPVMEAARLLSHEHFASSLLLYLSCVSGDEKE